MTFPITRAGKGDALVFAEEDGNITFLSGFASLSAMLADTARGYSFYEAGQGIVVLAEGYRYTVAASGASDHHLTTAAGLKLYVVPSDEGVYNFKAFNPAANGTTDDYAKLMLALSAVETGVAPNKIGPTIFFPKGVYRFNTTVELHNRVTLLGAGNDIDGSVLVFASGVSGFVVNAFNTGAGTAISEASATTAELSGAQGSIFTGLHFSSGAVGAKPSARADVDGIWLRAPATITDCAFQGWPGAGVRIEAWVPADKPSNPELWGDARGWRLEHCVGTACGRSPLRVRGNRADGGTCTICNHNENGWWGFDDHSTGTNFYLANHTATNGVGAVAPNNTTIRQSGMVSYEGSRYTATCVFGEDGDPDPDHLQAMVDTIPGTDPTVWKYRSAGSASTYYPAWVPDMDPGQYFPSGGLKFSNPDGAHVLFGVYCEDDEPGQHLNGTNLFNVGGIQTYKHNGGQIHGTDGALQFAAGTEFGTDDLKVTFSENTTTRRGLTAIRNGDDVWTLLTTDSFDDLTFGKEGEAPIFRITGITPYDVFGTSGGNGPGNPGGKWRSWMAQADFLGIDGVDEDGESEDDPRRHTTLTAAPTTGEWAQGEVVWNSAPTAGGNAAWICTTGGTPGTWKTCLPIAE